MDTSSSLLLALFSYDIYFPVIPMNANPYLYSKFHISLDPILAKNDLALSDRLQMHSSWHAATITYPSGSFGYYYVTKRSKLVADLCVSKTFAHSTCPYDVFIKTICNPLKWLCSFFCTNTGTLLTCIEAWLAPSWPEDVTYSTSINLSSLAEFFYMVLDTKF